LAQAADFGRISVARAVAGGRNRCQLSHPGRPLVERAGEVAEAVRGGVAGRAGVPRVAVLVLHPVQEIDHAGPVTPGARVDEPRALDALLDIARIADESIELVVDVRRTRAVRLHPRAELARPRGEVPDGLQEV